MRVKRTIWVRYMSVVLGMSMLFVLAACGAGENQAVKPDTQQQTSDTGSAQQNQTPVTSSNAKEPSEWEQTLELAKKEGKLVLTGAPGDVWRNALVTPFEKKYPDIKIEYTGVNSRDFWPRVEQERQLGQYLWDLRVGGPDPVVYKLANDGSLAPIRPLLTPENADDSKWIGGLEGLFADNKKQVVAGFLGYATSTVDVNRDIIPESELSSPEQLIDPKFKGKIVLQDPRGGAGLGYLAVLLEDYGEEFVKELLTKQDIVVTTDNRQQAEWIVRGTYPIAIGLLPDQMLQYEKQGLGLNVKGLTEGPIGLTIGFGGLQYLSNAPHPNASKVYINWILSKEGQEAVSHAMSLNSKRTDVPPANQAVLVDMKQFDSYIPHQDETMLETRRKAQELASTLIK